MFCTEWLLACSCRIVYECMPDNQVFSVLPVESILGKLPVVLPVGETGTIPYCLQQHAEDFVGTAFDTREGGEDNQPGEARLQHARLGLSPDAWQQLKACATRMHALSGPCIRGATAFIHRIGPATLSDISLRRRQPAQRRPSQAQCFNWSAQRHPGGEDNQPGGARLQLQDQHAEFGHSPDALQQPKACATRMHALSGPCIRGATAFIHRIGPATLSDISLLRT
jgi:hypothetical protein